MNLLELAKVAQTYYEKLKAPSLAQGWEKYVATDGTTCMFVKSDYEPSNALTFGSSVFSIIIPLTSAILLKSVKISKCSIKIREASATASSGLIDPFVHTLKTNLS